MAYENLKQEINSKVYENFRQEITGQRMNDVLIAIVNTLGRFYAFGGVVTPTTEVVVGEEKVFFLATQTGTYPNLGNLSVAEGELFVLFTHDTSWAKIVIDLTKLMTIINNAVAEEKERAEQVEQALLDKTEGIQRVSGGITIIDGIEIGALKNIAESAKTDAEDAKMEAQQTSIKTVEVTTDGNLLIVPKSGAPITFSPLKLAGVLEITGDIEDLEVGDNLVEAINAVFNMAVSADSTAQAAKGAADTALAEAEKKVKRVELIYHHDANNITLVGSETPLTFAQIAAFVEDPTKFVTMYGYDGDFLLPQYYDGGALTFTGLSVFEDYTASHRVIINIDDEIKNEVFDLARKSDVREKAQVIPTLTSGTQIATLKTEDEHGRTVETPLYAPQGGGESGKQGIISQTITYNNDGTKTYSNIVRGTIPDNLISQANLIGVTFNEETGYFEKGLKDYTRNDIEETLLLLNNIGSSATTTYMGADIRLSCIYARTAGYLSLSSLFAFTSKMSESLILGSNSSVNNISSAFRSCRRLEYAQDIRLVSPATTIDNSVFEMCYRLKHIHITNLPKSISFKDSSFLENESILFMISNASSEAGIVITLHANAYARAMADSAIQSALATKTNVTLASA